MTLTVKAIGSLVSIQAESTIPCMQFGNSYSNLWFIAHKAKLTDRRTDRRKQRHYSWKPRGKWFQILSIENKWTAFC